MTIKRMIELLGIEHECMLHASHNECDRKCEFCDLVQDDSDLHEMYTNVIHAMKTFELIPSILNEHFCITCSICNKYFEKDGSCPNEIETCNSKKHWKLLLERIGNEEV